MAIIRKIIENAKGVPVRSLRAGTLFVFEGTHNPNALFVKCGYNKGWCCINTGQVVNDRKYDYDTVFPIDDVWEVSND